MVRCINEAHGNEDIFDILITNAFKNDGNEMDDQDSYENDHVLHNVPI